MMRVTNRITFEAKDDSEALRVASERLGKDAVLLSSRPIKVGGAFGFFRKNKLLVTAGILEDEPKENKNTINKERREKDEDSERERLAAFQKLLELRQSAEMKSQPVQPIPSPVSMYPQPAPAISSSGDVYQSSIPKPAKANSINNSNNNALSDIKGEVEQLSERLSQVIKKLENSDLPAIEKTKFTGEYEDIYAKLLENEMSDDYARKLISEFSSDKNNEDFGSWLSKKINVASTEPMGAIGGRKIAFIGPTGVGKTTTIAKLAAIFSLWEHKKVLLLTSDTYRIAAVEQLRTYAKILGVPLEVVFEPDGIDKIMANYENVDIVLMDTAGRNQKDSRHLEAFKSLFEAFDPDSIHLVLAANMKSKDMFDVVERVSSLPVSHLIFTKLDETTNYGSLFDVANMLEKPFSFFTAGQNVPNDIDVASGNNLCSLLLGTKVPENGKV